MKFDSDKIGNVLLSEDGPLAIVVGYDGISDSYLVTNMRKGLQKQYFRIFEQIDKTYKYEEIITKLDDKIKELEEISEILSEKEKEFYYSRTNIDTLKIYRRLKECYTNGEANKYLSEKTIDEDLKKIYQKEYNNSQKGLRRALKRLYYVYKEDDYYTLLDYLIENKYNLNIENIDILLSKYKKIKKDFVNNYNNIINDLKTSRF